MTEAELYRRRAELLRSQAILMPDPDVKATLLAFAEECEQKAAKAAGHMPVPMKSANRTKDSQRNL